MFCSSRAGKTADPAELFACQTGENIYWNTGIPTNGSPDSNRLGCGTFTTIATIATVRMFGSIHNRPDQTHSPLSFPLIMYARFKNSRLTPDVFIVEAYDNENYARSHQTRHVFYSISTAFRSKTLCGHMSRLLSTLLLSAIASKQASSLEISKFRDTFVPSPGRRNNVFLRLTPFYCAVLTERKNKISIGSLREYTCVDKSLNRITASRAAPRRMVFILGFNATLLAIKRMVISRFSEATVESLWSCTSVPPFKIGRPNFQRQESDGRKTAGA